MAAVSTYILVVSLLRAASYVTEKYTNTPLFVNAMSPRDQEHWAEQSLLVATMNDAQAGWRAFNVAITPSMVAQTPYGASSVLFVLFNGLMQSALKVKGLSS